MDPSRRKFLLRCAQGASVSLLPAAFRNFSFASAQNLHASAMPGYHLHPHYRAQRPLDAMLLKKQPGLDEFVSEKYAAQLEAILAKWSAGLLQSAQNTRPIEEALAPNFEGFSWTSLESQLVRSGIIEVRRNKFSSQRVLGRDDFVGDFRSALKSFSQIITAEFQITSIEVSDPSPTSLKTRIRYELVGSGENFHREQRVGYWDLEWQEKSAGEFRVRQWQATEETQSRSTSPVFADITAAALGRNASYAAQLTHGSDYWRTVLDGASRVDIYGHNGVSVGDIDNDGFDEIYICQPAGLPNRLFRNRRDGTFEDVTEASGTGVLENTACALFADIDNDGRQDLVVVRTNGPLLFVNQGGGKFQPKPDAFKFASPPLGTFTGAALADYDRDGWLDIYFCLYLYYQGTEQYQYPTPYYDADNGPPNFMMRNNRDGTFRDVTEETGLNQNNTRYSFCCGWNDYNRDGWPDLYVVNDFGRKNLYRNNGNGTFTNVAAEIGVEDVGAGMGVCWLDYDNDGAEDLYVANMWTAAGERISAQKNFQADAPENVRSLYRKHAMGNSLLRNSGDRFQNATRTAGVGMGRWSWSSDAWDFDHDGFADIYIVNGMVSGASRDDLNSFFWRQVIANSPDEPKPSSEYEQGWSAINELIRADETWSGYERNVFYANNRDGTFSDVPGAVGLDFLEDGRSFALTDFDHDGRLEVVLKNRNAPQVRILKNVMKELPPSIAFNLRGTKSNRDAIGAVIEVESEAGRQTRSLQAGSGFLSQHSKEVLFGLGQVKAPVHATIRWPSGLTQKVVDIPLNHRAFVEEGSGAWRIEPFARPPAYARQESTYQPEELPTTVETWLLAPIAAPELDPKTPMLPSRRGKPLLLNFCAAQTEELQVLQQVHERGIQVIALSSTDSGPDSSRFSFPILKASDDVIGIYNLLYRYIFDRHRDLTLPTSFLLDEKGEIVKIYQGGLDPQRVGSDIQQIPRNTADRMAKALPFPGISEVTEFPRNYLSFGSVFYQRGYYEQSAAWFERALRDDPSSAEATYGLGSAYLQQGKNEDAQSCFERATKLHATYPDTLANAWNNLGLLAIRAGHPDEAIRDFQQALRLNPGHLVALKNLGNAYRQEQRWDEARNILEHAIAVGPQDAEANYSLAMVFAQLNNTDRAYDLLQRALKLRPDYPEALNNLGVLYLRTQRRDQAVASFEECIRVAPDFDQAYLNLARVYVLEDAPDKARTVLERLLQQHPDHTQARSMLNELSR